MSGAVLTAGPFAGLRAGHYAAILADPPWTFRAGGNRGAKQHYATMSLDALQALPVADLAAPDCALFLWVTDPLFPQALEVMAAWGFAYKTRAFEWGKTTRSGGVAMGLGYWTRANPESVWLGTRGRPARLARNVPRLQLSPRMEHSRKPEWVRDSITRLVGGPYLELFSRTDRPGWDCWGDDAGAFGTATMPMATPMQGALFEGGGDA